MTQPGYYIDTNIFLRYLLKDHDEQSPRCHALFKAIEDGTRRGWTTDLTIAEIVWVLSTSYAVTRPTIVSWLGKLLALPGLRAENKFRLRHTLHLYGTTPIDFIDAYNAAYILRKYGPTKLYSFDGHFDQVPQLERIEPGTEDEAEENGGEHAA